MRSTTRANPPIPSPNYRDIRDRNQVFESLFAYQIAPMALDTANGAEPVWGFRVIGNYFESLGIHPALKRLFAPAEDAARFRATMGVGRNL